MRAKEAIREKVLKERSKIKRLKLISGVIKLKIIFLKSLN